MASNIKKQSIKVKSSDKGRTNHRVKISPKRLDAAGLANCSHLDSGIIQYLVAISRLNNYLSLLPKLIKKIALANAKQKPNQFDGLLVECVPLVGFLSILAGFSLNLNGQTGELADLLITNNVLPADCLTHLTVLSRANQMLSYKDVDSFNLTGYHYNRSNTNNFNASATLVQQIQNLARVTKSFYQTQLDDLIQKRMKYHKNSFPPFFEFLADIVEPESFCVSNFYLNLADLDAFRNNYDTDQKLVEAQLSSIPFFLRAVHVCLRTLKNIIGPYHSFLLKEIPRSVSGLLYSQYTIQRIIAIHVKIIDVYVALKRHDSSLHALKFKKVFGASENTIVVNRECIAGFEIQLLKFHACFNEEIDRVIFKPLKQFESPNLISINEDLTNIIARVIRSFKLVVNIYNVLKVMYNEYLMLVNEEVELSIMADPNTIHSPLSNINTFSPPMGAGAFSPSTDGSFSPKNNHRFAANGSKPSGHFKSNSGSSNKSFHQTSTPNIRKISSPKTESSSRVTSPFLNHLRSKHKFNQETSPRPNSKGKKIESFHKKVYQKSRSPVMPQPQRNITIAPSNQNRSISFPSKSSQNDADYKGPQSSYQLNSFALTEEINASAALNLIPKSAGSGFSECKIKSPTGEWTTPKESMPGKYDYAAFLEINDSADEENTAPLASPQPSSPIGGLGIFSESDRSKKHSEKENPKLLDRIGASGFLKKTKSITRPKIFNNRSNLIDDTVPKPEKQATNHHSKGKEKLSPSVQNEPKIEFVSEEPIPSSPLKETTLGNFLKLDQEEDFLQDPDYGNTFVVLDDNLKAIVDKLSGSTSEELDDLERSLFVKKEPEVLEEEETKRGEPEVFRLCMPPRNETERGEPEVFRLCMPPRDETSRFFQKPCETPVIELETSEKLELTELLFVEEPHVVDLSEKPVTAEPSLNEEPTSSPSPNLETNAPEAGILKNEVSEEDAQKNDLSEIEQSQYFLRIQETFNNIKTNKLALSSQQDEERLKEDEERLRESDCDNVEVSTNLLDEVDTGKEDYGESDFFGAFVEEATANYDDAVKANELANTVKANEHANDAKEDDFANEVKENEHASLNEFADDVKEDELKDEVNLSEQEVESEKISQNDDQLSILSTEEQSAADIRKSRVMSKILDANEYSAILTFLRNEDSPSNEDDDDESVSRAGSASPNIENSAVELSSPITGDSIVELSSQRDDKLQLESVYEQKDSMDGAEIEKFTTPRNTPRPQFGGQRSRSYETIRKKTSKDSLNSNFSAWRSQGRHSPVSPMLSLFGPKASSPLANGGFRQFDHSHGATQKEFVIRAPQPIKPLKISELSGFYGNSPVNTGFSPPNTSGSNHTVRSSKSNMSLGSIEPDIGLILPGPFKAVFAENKLLPKLPPKKTVRFHEEETPQQKGWSTKKAVSSIFRLDYRAKRKNSSAANPLKTSYNSPSERLDVEDRPVTNGKKGDYGMLWSSDKKTNGLQRIATTGNTSTSMPIDSDDEDKANTSPSIGGIRLASSWKIFTKK